MISDHFTPRTILIFGLVAVLLLAGCSGTSSSIDTAASEGVVSTVTITDKIETSGNLSASQLVQLTWGTDGLVEQVNVKVGQKVKEGDILAALKADSVATDMITAQADLATAQGNLDLMTSSKLTLAQAQQNVISGREALETAENNLAALDYPRATSEYIKYTDSRIWDAKLKMTQAYKKYLDVEHHIDGDIQKTAAYLAFTSAQQNYYDLVATYNYITAKATQSDYDAALATRDVARANLEDARRKRDTVKDGVDPLVLAAAKAKVAAAQAIVNGIQTIAPFDGEVLAVQSVTGNAVKKGDNSAAMVDRNTLKIDTQVDETSMTNLKLGNDVEVTMDSLPGEILKGKVTLINPIGSVVNGLVKYTVTLSLEPTDKPLLFGATASIVIITGAPHDMLAVPVNAVQSDSKGEYLNVISADGNSTQRVDVTSGDLVESMVTITTTGSLKAGDRIELGTSSSSSSSSSSRNNNGGGIMVPGAGGGPGGG